MSLLTKDFWLESNITILINPTSSKFLRESFSNYKPCLLKETLNGLGSSNWSIEYLTEILQNKSVKVNFTPHGYADSVIKVQNDSLIDNYGLVDKVDIDDVVRSSSCSEVFVYPLQHSMLFSLFYDMLINPDVEIDAVPYLSEQNDNLRQEFSELLNNNFIPNHYSLAKECFQESSDGNEVIPEAVNLWIGDERSASSLHKDHFEVCTMDVRRTMRR